MPFRLVYLQDLLDLGCQLSIYLRKAFRDIFMHSAFRDPKDFCSIADGSATLEDVVAYIYHTLPDVVFHRSGPFLPPQSG